MIHSHTPLLTLGPSLRRKSCVIVGQGPVVDIAQQEYPLACINSLLFINSFSVIYILAWCSANTLCPINEVALHRA